MPRTTLATALLTLTLILATAYPAAASEGPSLPQMRSEQVRAPNLLLLRAATFDPLGVLPQGVGAGLSEWRDQNRGRVLGIVQLGSTPTAKHRADLDRAGVERLYYLPNNAYLVRYDLDRADGLEAVAGVRAVLRLPKWARLEPGLLETAPDGEGYVAVEIQAAPGRDARLVAAIIAKRIPGAILDTDDSHHARGRAVARIPADQLFAAVDLLTGLEDVLAVEVWRPKQLLNNHSIWVGQSYDTVNTTNYALTAPIWNQGIYGEGQIVCVNDSGLDSDMCFFRYDSAAASKTVAQSPVPPEIGTLEPAKKVIAYYVEPGADAYDASLAQYHGTHVTGSVAGDNFATLSAGGNHGHDSGDGMAPRAKIVFQDVGNSSGGLGGLTGDLTDMFQQAYDAGARLHSDSWGTTSSVYDATAMDMDEFMYRHEDFLFVVAMGNSGTAPADGTIGSPATAKGIVSVGGTTNGGVASRADNLMDYSRGPVDDGRLKPDIVSPGSSIISAAGTTSNTDDNCATKTLSGTSMATPTTSGYLALLRQYFTDGFYPTGAAAPDDARTPSGALMKATLLAGGMPLGGTDLVSSSAVSPIPSMDQGWGRTHLDQSLYFAGDGRQLRVWDVRHEAGLATAEVAEYALEVGTSAEPLNVRLAWSDPESTTLAAVNLVNNLDLEVVAPGGTMYRGNVFSGGVSATGGSADVLNPIEGVVVPSPALGTWTIRVKGTAVPGTGSAPYSERQGYAVAATSGSCGSMPAAPADLVAADNAPVGIGLTWSGAGAEGFLIYRAPGASPNPADFSLVGTSATPSFTDVHVQGGYTYSYRVRATDGCAESAASAGAQATYTGPCTLDPLFGGVEAVTNDTASVLCDLVVEWSPAVSQCPTAPGVVYNLYRGTTPYFSPGPANLVTSTAGTSFTDYSVAPLETAYYVVRAEDATSGNGGPANDGNEEANSQMLSGTAWAATSSPGVFTDDGGDTSAKLFLDGEWRVTNQENHTPGGGLSYHNAPDGSNHAAGQCSAATTPAMTLQAGAPQLSYWTRYNLEVGWDGVVVEVNDCDPDCDTGTWTVTTPAGGYPGDFSETGNPPVNACAYPASQDCFNGPAGNTALTSWTQYTHDLSPWAGQTVQVRWHFSSDGGFEVEGFYLDDVEVTLASVPDDCSNRNGLIRLDDITYSCTDAIAIALGDSDLAGAGAHAVTIVSDTEPGGEVVSLLESPPGTGAFAAAIATTAGPVATDGELSVSDGDTVTVTYVDADDGLGGSDVVKTDTAVADCRIPAISNVAVLDAGAVSATIGWDTDEAADSSVTFGLLSSPPPTTIVSLPTPVLAHEVLLGGLTECTRYVFLVTSADAAGNQAVDDNGGGYFGFATGVEVNPTYDSTDTPRAIADNTTFTSPIQVPLAKTVLDVNVQIDVTHTYDGDLDIFLISPAGTRVELTTDTGGSGDNFTGTIFDDEAATAITSGAAPFAGSFRPETPLSAVDGQSALGAWQLEVTDDAGGDTGTLSWWKLTLTFPDEVCDFDLIFSDGFETGDTTGWSQTQN